MSRQRSTSTPLGNGRYPSMSVLWTEDDDCNGWSGKATFWTDGNTKEEPEHTVRIRQGQPLSNIFVETDSLESGYGCWSMTMFDGAGLTERDLQWAAAYAMEALKRKRMLFEHQHSKAEVSHE